MPKAGWVWKNMLFVKFGQIRSLITFGKILFFEKNNYFKKITMLSLNVIEWFIVITYRNLFFRNITVSTEVRNWNTVSHSA